MGSNTLQYCRYCSHCVAGNGWWCDEHGAEINESRATHQNTCEDFDFCRFAADDENLVYRPRKRRPKLDQIKLF